MIRPAVRIVAALALLAGCSDADAALRALDGAKTAACACKPGDAACADAAAEKLAAWHRSYDKVDGSAAQAAKAKADLKATDDCLAKARATP